jgi:hypothetical protein
MIEQRILNSILHSDYDDLEELIEKHPQLIGRIGICGESPCHIAIYKSDMRLLSMLLSIGDVDPNIVNQNGNTLVHLAALLGLYDFVELLYGTKKCNLRSRNKLDQTPYEISNCAVDDSIVFVSRLFAEYKYHHDSNEQRTQSMLADIATGRKRIAVYLHEKMKLDHDSLVSGILSSSVRNMTARHNRSRIIRGLSAGENYSTYYGEIKYPHIIDKSEWSADELRVFHGDRSVFYKAVQSVFVNDYITNAIKVGFYNALLRRRDYQHRSQLYKLNYYLDKLTIKSTC